MGIHLQLGNDCLCLGGLLLVGGPSLLKPGLLDGHSPLQQSILLAQFHHFSLQCFNLALPCLQQTMIEAAMNNNWGSKTNMRMPERCVSCCTFCQQQEIAKRMS